MFLIPNSYGQIDSEYLNETYRFSIVPPSGWNAEELVPTEEEPFFVEFYPDKYRGVTSPIIGVGYIDSGEFIELHDLSERQLLDDFLFSFVIGAGSEGVEVEVLEKNLERTEDYAKLTVDIIMKMSFEDISIEIPMLVIMWVYESGEVYMVAFTGQQVDYDDYMNEFRSSADTVKIEPKPRPPVEQGGGCLIATATYGSELAPQVQQLRELRDNTLLQTESGMSFMNTFNDFYYSFSPYIADYERENPIFKEAVKITITPMISSLSILNYVDMDSESEIMGYGISLILLNMGMYVAVPAMIGFKVHSYCKSKK